MAAGQAEEAKAEVEAEEAAEGARSADEVLGNGRGAAAAECAPIQRTPSAWREPGEIGRHQGNARLMREYPVHTAKKGVSRGGTCAKTWYMYVALAGTEEGQPHLQPKLAHQLRGPLEQHNSQAGGAGRGGRAREDPAACWESASLRLEPSKPSWRAQGGRSPPDRPAYGDGRAVDQVGVAVHGHMVKSLLCSF